MEPDFCPAGIIAEFNPLHLGHQALIQAARQGGATHVAVVMSGDFVQRGGPAVVSKWSRAEMALRAGADAVFELPLPWAMAGAERFARGGVSLLWQAGCRRLCFGSEWGGARELQQLAALLLTGEFSQAVKGQLARGLPFAAARQAAVARLAGQQAAALLQTPNNTLGVEYCKAMKALGMEMEPLTIPRLGAGHHAAAPQGGFASATALREMLASGGGWEPYVPPETAAILRREAARGACPAEPARMERAVLARLRAMSREELARLPDMSEGLENRVFAAARRACSLEELLALAKTKRYSMARLRRIVFSAFLGLSAEDGAGLPPYLRVLGFTERGVRLLQEAKRRGGLPLLTHSSDFSKLDKTGKNVVEWEGKGSDLFALFLPRPAPCGLNQTHGVVRV